MSLFGLVSADLKLCQKWSTNHWSHCGISSRIRFTRQKSETNQMLKGEQVAIIWLVAGAIEKGKEEHKRILYPGTEGIASPQTRKKYDYHFKCFVEHFEGIAPESYQ